MLASPNMEAKSQLLSLNKPKKMVNYQQRWILDLDYFMQKYSWDLCVRVGSSFLLHLTPNTSPEPHLQKVLPCGHPCHTWDLGLMIPCEAGNPNFHALNGLNCMGWPQVTWDLRLETRCEVVNPNFHVPTVDIARVFDLKWLGTED